MLNRRELLAAAAAATTLPSLPAAAAPEDPIERLIALSRDASGAPHVYAAALLDTDGVPAPSHHPAALPITEAEGRALADALRAKDAARFHQHGPMVAGRKYFFLKDDEDGRLMWFRRDGYGLCVEQHDGGVVIAQSAPGMAHGNANLALLRFLRAPRVG
jgi:hypothetical protein